ncbi:hypothetical protein TI03_01965, partial [Achromatium sp. WMS1]
EPDIEKSWCTPLSNDLFNRSNEIDTWLHTWGHWVKGYCILDDGKSLFSSHHYPNLIWIEKGDSGFEIDHYIQAFELLM